MAEISVTLTERQSDGSVRANLNYKGFASSAGANVQLPQLLGQVFQSAPGGPQACVALEYGQAAPLGNGALADLLAPSTLASPRANNVKRAGVAASSVMIPEAAWSKDSELFVAQGAGELTDAISGLPIFSGSWERGFRHGKGRGVLTSSADGQPLGVYDGDWVYGMRHGRGILIEEGTGARFEGAWSLDRRHGPGVETLPGGGTFRGSWSKGKRHGCGVFTWPGGRAEMREYEHGALVAARAVADGTVSVPGAMTSPALSRIASRYDMAVAMGQVAGTGAAGSAAAPLSAGSTALGLPAGFGPSLDTSGLGGQGDLSSRTTPPGPILDSSTTTGPAGAGGELGGVVDMYGPSGMAVGLPLQMHAGGVSMPVAVPMPVPGGHGVHFAVQLPVGPPGPGGSSMPGAVPSVTVCLNADVVRLLRHTSVNDLPRPRSSVIGVDTTEKLESCITKMTEFNVLSLPVRNPATGVYTAVIHLLDTCAFLLDLVARKKATFSPVAGGLRETLAHQKRFSQSPVSEVLEMSSHLTSTAFKPLPAGGPLIFAAQTLADGVHAVPVVDPDGNIVRMLTQADVVRFLAAHVDELGPLGGITIGQLLPELVAAAAAANAAAVAGAASAESASGAGGAGGASGVDVPTGTMVPASASPAPLVVAGLRDRSMEVLQRMRALGAPAAAVVDAYGGMVANLSFSDLKTVARRANFSALSLPVQQFLAALERGSEVMNPSIVVKASTPLSSVLLTLAATRVHQLYFVDEQLHPVAAIRTGDVLRILLGPGDAA